MALQSTPLSSSIANVYVSSGNSAISAVYFCNTSNVATTFNVWLQSAATAGFAANANVQIYNSIQLAGNDTYVMDWEKIVLANGDIVRANSAGTVTTTVSYIGI